MDKIILKDKTELELIKVEGLNITFSNKKVDDLEKVLTKDNCSKIQLTTEQGEVYGVYNNLECISITKNLEDNTIVIQLKQLDSTSVRIDALESAVNDLGNVINKLSEGSVQ